MKEYIKKHKIIFIILFFALLLRLVYFGIILKNFGETGFYITKNGDSVEYYNAAKNILERGVFSIATAPPFTPEVFRTPGYSAFIAFLYKIIPSVAWVIFWQNIIFIAFVFAFYIFAKKYFGRNVSLVAASFLSFEPSIIYINNQLLSENIFIIFVFLAFYFSLKAVWGRGYFAAISGLCLVAALYLRPIGQYLFVVLGAVYLIAALMRKISWKKFILLFLLSATVFYAAMFPWMARNKNIFGLYAVTTSSSATFGSYAAAMARNLNERPVWLYEVSFSPVATADLLQKNTILYIISHPATFGKVYALSLIGFFFGDSYLAVFDRLWPGLEEMRLQKVWAWTPKELFGLIFGHRGAEAAAFWSGKIVRAIIVPLFLAGLYFGFKKKENGFLLAGMLLLIFYFTLAAGAVNYSRFRFAVEPYVYTFVGIAAVNILRKFKKNTV